MATPGYADDAVKVQRRLRKIEGQVRGLQRMIAEERYCIEVLDQVAATTRALQGVALQLLEDHLSHCVREAVRSGGPGADQKVAEAAAAVARMVRSS